MKHFFILAIVILSCMIVACTQQSKRKPVAGSDSASVQHDAGLPQNFYKRFEGTIANKQVVMHLQAQNNTIDGRYYYTKYGSNLDLYTPSDSSLTPDSLTLIESDRFSHDPSVKEAKMKLRYQNGSLSGQWFSPKDKIYSISLKETYPTGTHKFTVDAYSDSVRAFPDSSKSPAATITQLVVQASGKSPKDVWLNKQIKHLLTIGSDTSMVDGLQHKRAAYFADYKRDVQSYMKDHTELPAFLNYESVTGVNIEYNATNIVVLNYHHYQYLGGAHGGYAALYHTFDLQNQKEWSQKDVVTADSLTLQHLLEKNFRKQYNIAPDATMTSILFENKLPPNDNFYISPSGIGFVYNQYEVAPYAAGVIDILIPYDDLTPYLTPAIKKRMNIDL